MSTPQAALLKRFRFVPDYSGPLEAEFHDFVTEVFGADLFRPWEQLGFRNESYRTFSLYDDSAAGAGRLVANVSGCLLDVLIGEGGQAVPALQLATVGTRDEFRGQGLSRFLMNAILETYAAERFVFLFGNESVVDFYPRFGLQPVTESFFRCTVSTAGAGELGFTQLDFADAGDRAYVLACLRSMPLPGRSFCPVSYDYIFAFHAIHSFPDSLYRLPDDAGWIVAQREGVDLHIYDYRGPRDLLLQVHRDPLGQAVDGLVFHFTPDCLELPGSLERLPADPDSPLFVQTERFSLPPGSFKFPLTAQT